MTGQRWNREKGLPAWMVVLAGLLAVLVIGALSLFLARGISAADDPVALPTGTPPAPQSPAPSPPPAVVIPSPLTLNGPAVIPGSPGSPPGSAVTLPTIVTPLGPGASGPTVTAFQQRLAALNYLVGPINGTYGSATGYAVTAFQKVENLPRTGLIDGATQAAFETAGIPTPAYASPPNHIEVDLARQVLFVVSGGQVSATVEVSTGSGEKFYEKGSSGAHYAVTPNGVFSVLWKHNGWWTSPLGQLYKPSFIDDTLGIAIHGYPSVPPQPASHGCIRVPMPFADTIYAQYTAVGTTVIIHGGPDGPNP
jgi:lipoprotein-anchoring transpeptidase ErfK/SrfK